MLKTTAIIAASLLVGSRAVQVLHAQSKPPGYLFAEVAVTVDEDAYKNSPFFKETIKSIRRKYIAGGFNKAVSLKGAAPPNRLVLLQFESMDKAKGWYDADQRAREDKEGSKVASRFRIMAIEGAQ